MTTVDDDRPDTTGGKLGNRLLTLLSKGIVLTRAQMSPHTVAVARSVFTDVTNHVSDELRDALGPLWMELAEHPDASDKLRPLLLNLGQERGQAWAWVAGTATGAALGGGVLNLITNELNPVVLPIIASNPNAPISPSDAAAAMARRLTSGLDLVREAKYSGIGETRFATLVELARHPMTPDQALVALNRGLITPGHAQGALERAGIDPNDIGPLLQMRRQVLAPADLAAMWNRDIVTTEQGRQLAALSGVDSEDFDRLTELGGEPPGLQDLLFAYRRGVITRERLYRGIIQGPLRKEWFDVVESLGLVPMSIADAIGAAVKGHLSADEARKIAGQNGLFPDQFDTLLAAAGEPPGVQQMLAWWRRRLMTEAQVTQGIRESRLNNKYVEIVKAASEVLPPMVTIRSMFAHGSITKERALDLLLQHGYAPDIAAALLLAAQGEKQGATRDLTKTEILELYQARSLSRDAARGVLIDLGYDQDEAEALLELTDIKRLRAFQTAAINRVHAAYVAHRINETEATTNLDQLQVNPQQRTDLLRLWDLERATFSRSLTPAEIIAAAKRPLISVPEAATKLEQLGYSPDDARLKLRLAGLQA